VYELTGRAVLFDMDGTLVDSTALVARLWGDWGAGHGIALDKILAVSHGRRTLDTIALIAPHLDAAAETRALEQQERVTHDGVVPLHGAAQLLASLRPDEWAVVTSAPHAIAVERIRHAGLPQPEHLIGADDVEAGKPDPEGYLLAATRLGVPPQDCVVVEDTPAGILAARAAGMRVLAVGNTFPQAELLGADWVPHYGEVRFRRQT
jgi:mannitol-1-/sugar-/sorbitol-6-phosphatase